jgi:hypothetical protein
MFRFRFLEQIEDFLQYIGSIAPQMLQAVLASLIIAMIVAIFLIVTSGRPSTRHQTLVDECDAGRPSACAQLAGGR